MNLCFILCTFLFGFISEPKATTSFHRVVYVDILHQRGFGVAGMMLIHYLFNDTSQAEVPNGMEDMDTFIGYVVYTWQYDMSFDISTSALTQRSCGKNHGEGVRCSSQLTSVFI